MQGQTRRGRGTYTYKASAWWSQSAVLPVYTVDDEGLEQDGAVLGFMDGRVNHACFLGSPDWGRKSGRNKKEEVEKDGRAEGRVRLREHGGDGRRQEAVAGEESGQGTSYNGA